ncbi:MAG: hypothetical protein NTX52_08595 [Planctomycetota bacterium]|nr:hypothetical protein [Planctomycetota bacterium]
MKGKVGLLRMIPPSKPRQHSATQKTMEFLPPETVRTYTWILDFMETVYIEQGAYTGDQPSQERPIDVLVLNFTKVVNDCRAILLLVQRGFYIQAGILCRSTSDACNLMMHVAFEGENAILLPKWLHYQRLSHWQIMERLNSHLGKHLDLQSYETTRRKLDDFVHANYPALQLYPAQSPGPTVLDNESFGRITFWKGLIRLFIVSCLLCIPLLDPDLQEDTNSFLSLLGVV